VPERSRLGSSIRSGVLRYDYGVGAETLANDFTLLIQHATWLGQKFDGLALDWSKCYDHVPLDMLQEAMEVADFGPFMAMCRTPRRIIAGRRPSDVAD